MTNDVKAMVTESAVEFVASDLRPFNIVGGEGFLKFAQTMIDIGAKYGKIDARTAIPNPSTVARHAKDTAAELRPFIAVELAEAFTTVGGSITFDIWTDDYRKISYLGQTVHYTDSKFRLRERILCVAEFDGELRKTGENIRKLVMDGLRRFNINCVNNIVFVTDRGSNVLAALRNTSHIFCTAHILNNILEHSTKPSKQGSDDTVTILISSCRALVTYFKRSGLQSRLKKTLKGNITDNVDLRCLRAVICRTLILGLPNISSHLGDVDTRRNSKLAMLSSIDKQWEDLTSILKGSVNAKLLEDIDREALTDMINFLRPFKVTRIQHSLGVHYL